MRRRKVEVQTCRAERGWLGVRLRWRRGERNWSASAHAAQFVRGGRGGGKVGGGGKGAVVAVVA